MRFSSPLGALLLCAAPLHMAAPAGALARSPAARIEVLEVAGRTLRGNPLGDPAARRVALFLPAETPPGAPLPVVYYLPGYGGSSEDFIAQGERSPFAAVVQQCASEGAPLLIAVPDARNRWGGSQYLNSPAQGSYADYIAEEIVAAVEAAHPASTRIIAGHSSGGYGALMLGMARQKVFGAVVALSPDGDFEVTHRGLVEQPEVRRVTPRDIDAFFGPAKTAPRPQGAVELVLGLSAAYTPAGASQPGRIQWLYDAAGKWQPQVWQRWLDLDPLLIVRGKKDAFSPAQRIYLDGSAQDEWGFNLSTRKIYDVLQPRGAHVTFHEPPGHHSDRIPERLARGLSWVLKPTP